MWSPGKRVELVLSLINDAYCGGRATVLEAAAAVSVGVAPLYGTISRTTLRQALLGDSMRNKDPSQI